jgi:glycosyltransferase involved in cell wall biosynthesis
MGIKICYVAGRERTYSRTRIIVGALEREGFEVTTCLPPDRSPRHYPKVLFEFLRKKRGAELIFVGFYGQLLLPFVRLLTRRPIVLDLYVSTFGAMVDDRRHAKPGSLKAKLSFLVDYVALRLADRVIVDTTSQMLWYEKTYGVSRAKFSRLFLPSDDAIMRPRARTRERGRFRAHFHGEYAPFHGVDVIVRAAHALADADVEFQLVGTGMTYARDRALARELGVRNIEFVDRVPYDELAQHMSDADVCLGIFGENPRAERELTNKVVEAMAVGGALITRKSPPVEELLADGESVLLVEPGRPEQLAAAILRLKNDPALRDRLGQSALRVFQEHCTMGVFAPALKQIILEQIGARKP